MSVFDPTTPKERDPGKPRAVAAKSPAVVSSAAIRRLGDYRIVRQIGQGGMGAVYEAIQESLGRRVALKILSDRGRYRPNEIERFGLEARSAARLHHGNIVPVYGVGENQGAHYYAMQFIDGRGLDRILDDARKRRREAGHITDSSPRQGVGPSSVTFVVAPVAIEPSSDDAMDAGGGPGSDLISGVKTLVVQPRNLPAIARPDSVRTSIEKPVPIEHRADLSDSTDLATDLERASGVLSQGGGHRASGC
jgi:Protein kinase domain